MPYRPSVHQTVALIIDANAEEILTAWHMRCAMSSGTAPKNIFSCAWLFQEQPESTVFFLLSANQVAATSQFASAATILIAP